VNAKAKGFVLGFPVVFFFRGFDMKCSHGLAYEMKCGLCMSEALARVAEDAKISALKNPVPQGQAAGETGGIQKQVDRKKD